jgi:hypothetical protein
MLASVVCLALSVVLAFSPKAPVPAELRPEKEAPKDKAELYRQLDDDFQELLKAEADPEPLREAARLLAQTDQGAHWTSFFQATALLRQHRSKAAIPLLMKYMVEHASLGPSHISLPQYAETINILAGEKVATIPENGPDRQKAMEAAVLKLYGEWWRLNKKTFTTDLGKMPDERLRFVVSELLRHSGKELADSQRTSAPDRLVSAEALYQSVAASLRGRDGRRQWCKEELHGRMTPVLLNQAGYTKKPTDDPTAGPTRVAYASIPLLAVLYQQGKAPLLDEIAADPKQNNATRLTCILALQFAGEDMNVKAVSSILEADSRLECRVLALLALGLSGKTATAVPKLVAALDDKNREIRLSAVHSLQTFAPKAALPKLSKVVRDGEPAELVQPGIQLLGAIGGDEVATVLAEHMEKLLKNGGKQNYDVYHVLRAFSTATNTDWIEAGAHQPAYYAEQAQKAIEWWKAREKK